ncbi:hypothetical protein E7Z59_07070 [Robertkochia marina]|uniref:Uncharacterized protein n=1 Tax=Robertkochia marina TaxID=1227945 RepID=A0A4V6RRS9_9FLAO|nr:hypothetical protein [Robertkochia marina]THD67416.1 hypothetical protein E7Z59_07070 [Robertkochia marina]TRZ40797.1 hypothetical protein D3A96_15275 [Robertkochia marina]
MLAALAPARGKGQRHGPGQPTTPAHSPTVTHNMKKPTVLKIYSSLYLIGCIIFTILNYSNLVKEEGWGMVGMIGLISIGIIGLVLDFVLTKVIKNKITLNLTELFIVLLFSIELLIEIKK